MFTKFEAYCNPRTNLLLERRKFFKRSQKDGECIDTYLTELRNITSNCEFAGLEDGLLLYRIVDGVRSDVLRDRLLRTAHNLDLTKAVNICRADELTKLSLKQFGSSSNEAEVNYLARGSRYQKKSAANNKKGNFQQQQKENSVANRSSCTRCGHKHEPRKCHAWGKTCSKCGKKNHFSAHCRSSDNNSRYRDVNEIRTEDLAERYVIEMVESNDENISEATVVLKIGSQDVRMKLDTGAEVSVLPLRVFQSLIARDDELARTLDVKRTNVKLVAYGGTVIPVLGTVEILVRSEKGRQQVIRFFVVETTSRAVLSLKACQALELLKILCSIEKSDVNNSNKPPPPPPPSAAASVIVQ